ncbi:glycoside hydrolase family 2 protein [Teredinibacter haidensis]|uniref:glycoside hydrolase family 2 protein n=1 Tax=Teredinibacter haidensis TaxID=2731755 RepID=UPI0009F8C79A|nr:glycoside hydrolase family 2 TIM barrel-domain containing protein [Teredinibacter haidensis]
MKKIVSSLLVAVFFGSLLFGCEQKNSRDTVNDSVVVQSIPSAVIPPELFNSGWTFFKSDQVVNLDQALVADNWLPVSLPHSANIEPRIVNDQWQGDAWYQKTFVAPTHWQNKKIFIDFEAAMNAAEIWLNGEEIGEHLGGYLPFSVALNAHLIAGENTLTVRLDNRDNAISGPKPLDVLDFNMYGGLYRNVWLRVENPIHITDAVNAGKEASGGIFVRYPKVTESEAQVAVQTHLAMGLTEEDIHVKQRLFFAGDEVAVAVAKVTGETSIQTLSISKPKLWSPDAPNLYQLETQVLVDGVIFDSEITTIGIREFKLVDNQLWINGKKTFLRGVNRHQDYPYIGYALSDAAQFRDAEKIKAAGFDYVRLSHYPHSKAFMKAADKLGLVLLDAILGWQYADKENPAFVEHALQTCRDLIRRDRNHASVLAWECSLNESDMGEKLVNQFNTTVHKEFPGKNVYSAGWVDNGYDIYLQARQHRLGHYKEPGKPYVVSEYGDWEYYAMNAGLNQDSWGGLLQEERSSRQLLSAGEKRLQQQAANLQESHDDNFNTPAFADGYWVMFDYNRGYADDIEASGIMSLERLPKFSYYFYQSQRDADSSGGPLANDYMVHIASHWQPESSSTFYVYSNADDVELRLNGQILEKGVRDTARYPNLKNAPFLFDLKKFEPGVLEAEALVAGKTVARHSVATPGEAESLFLAVDKSSIAPQADVNDVVFIRAQLLDKKGFSLRSNSTQVTFVVKGDAELVSPVTITSEDGIASALVRLGGQLETVVIQAKTAEGLSGELKLR